MQGIYNERIVLPYIEADVEPVWHIFAVRTRNRDELAAYLGEKGIQTVIHYPTAIHCQQAYAGEKPETGELPVCEELSSTELSLPLYYGMGDEIEYVIDALNTWKAV